MPTTTGTQPFWVRVRSRRVRVALWLVLIFPAWGPAAILPDGQLLPPPAKDVFDKDDFLSRKKWYVTFTFSLAGKGEATRTDGNEHYMTSWSILREVSGSFEFDKVGQDGPRKSVLAKGERYQGRYISWRVPEGLSTVTYQVFDRVVHKSVEHGEGGAETNTSGYTKFVGQGTMQLGGSRELKCDLKDMVFDFDFNGIDGRNDGLGLKSLRLSGEVHVFTPVTKVGEDITYPLEEFGIRGALPEIGPLLPQLVSRKLQLSGDRILINASMPVEALPFFPSHSGSNPGGPEYFNGRTTAGGPPLLLSLDVIISPTPPSRAKLILKPRDYETWRPECSDSEDKPGNMLEVGWRVEEEGGDPSKPAKVHRLVFSLLNTSKEPGVCMNYPLVPKMPADFDLKFPRPAALSASYAVASDGQKLTLEDKMVRAGHGSIGVECYDAGATGVLVAEAELEDGRVLKAVIEGTPETQLMIPDYEPGVSWIARDWRAKNAPGKRDDADDENNPVGDGQRGDGLTVWEEYRGFWAHGRWEGGDPTTKDLFVFNGIGGQAQHGLWLFGSITGLRVHDQLAPGEIKSDRVINFNHGARPHLVDQHCVAVTEGGFETTGEDGVVTSGSICNITNGANFPGPPKNTREVSILPSMLAGVTPLTQFRNGETYAIAGADRTICHELGHALGIRHHGDKDLGLQIWTYRRNDHGDPIIYVGGAAVRVRSEETDNLMDPLELFGGKKPGEPMLVWTGERHGQHAGDVACVLRYVIARAYRSQSEPDLLYYHSHGEIKGNRLCTSPAGTGVNMPTHDPQSRYFGADADRGDCTHKFVVSDHWEKIH